MFPPFWKLPYDYLNDSPVALSGKFPIISIGKFGNLSPSRLASINNFFSVMLRFGIGISKNFLCCWE